LNKISTTWRIYILLVLLLAASNAIQVLLPSYQSMLPASLPVPIPVIVLVNTGIAIILYGGLGLAGLKLAGKLGFAGIWDAYVTNRQRFLTPGIVGALLGVFLIISDIIFSRFNGIGNLQHPPFPSSFFASLSAGIGEEMLFRLFFISFWVWLISYIILRNRWRNQVFWVIAGISAIVFAIGHVPSLMMLYNFTSVNDISPVLWAEIILLNGAISIFAAYYMRKYGFLSAVMIHFSADLVWHVIRGLF
jgi:membrane protease YdiL (CAAX protease family)